MTLWGKTDNLAGAPKYIARKAWFNAASTDVISAADDTINLVPSNTGFNTGDQVHYSINGGTVIAGLTDDTNYFVRVVGAGLIELYDTYAHAIAAPATTGRLNITGVGVGVQTLQKTGLENPYTGESGIFFVDKDEAQVSANKAKGFRSPGWWLYKTYTDVNSVVRHKAECLISMMVPSATSGDAEDTVLTDAIISLVSGPADITVAETETAEFSVEATVVPSTATIVYQWQVSDDSGSTWANVATGTGGTTATYTTAATTAGMDGYQYQCVLSVTGGNTITTDAATLTVTA